MAENQSCSEWHEGDNVRGRLTLTGSKLTVFLSLFDRILSFSANDGRSEEACWSEWTASTSPASSDGYWSSISSMLMLINACLKKTEISLISRTNRYLYKIANSENAINILETEKIRLHKHVHETDMDITMFCLYLYWSVASCFLWQVIIHRVQTLLWSRLPHHEYAHHSCCLLENCFKHACLHSSQCLYSTDRLQGLKHIQTHLHTQLDIYMFLRKGEWRFY